MISTNEIYNVLLFEFPYFKKINEEKRQLLCTRTKFFIEGTNFIPRKGLEITNRMKILVAACSQQLTLGFKKHYEYAYFDKIIIYPEKYFSTITQQNHTGEMNTAGIIVLSWEDFYKGMSIDDNAYNVGLHEFAHALEFMDIADKNVDEIYSACLDKFTALAADYLKHQPDKPLFRKYATTNLSEFLAVATEYYFEKPHAFFEQEPELFDAMDKAYQQNILSKTQDTNKKSLGGKVIKGDLIFGEKTSWLTTVLLHMPYVVVNVYLGFIAYHKPLIGILLLLIGNYFITRYILKSTFIVYSNYVQIEHPFVKKLINKLFPDFYKLQSLLEYAHVLYVSVQESNKSKFDLSRMKHDPIYICTLAYWYNGKISYATGSSDMLNYNSLLKFLYVERKVGTRLNGNLKKY